MKPLLELNGSTYFSRPCVSQVSEHEVQKKLNPEVARERLRDNFKAFGEIVIY